MYAPVPPMHMPHFAAVHHHVHHPAPVAHMPPPPPQAYPACPPAVAAPPVPLPPSAGSIVVPGLGRAELFVIPGDAVPDAVLALAAKGDDTDDGAPTPGQSVALPGLSTTPRALSVHVGESAAAESETASSDGDAPLPAAADSTTSSAIAALFSSSRLTTLVSIAGLPGDVRTFWVLPSAIVNAAALAAKPRPERQLQVCEFFSTAGTCPNGPRCPAAHVPPHALTPSSWHVNVAWHSVADVQYDRFKPGAVFEIAAPGTREIVDRIPAWLMLRTGVLRAQRRPLTHCQHYYAHGKCELGERCKFVHAVFVNPASPGLRRAPRPAALGRTAGRGCAPVEALTPEPPVCPPRDVPADNATTYGWCSAAEEAF